MSTTNVSSAGRTRRADKKKKEKKTTTVGRNWCAWNDPLATTVTGPHVTTPRLEGLTPPTVGHDSMQTYASVNARASTMMSASHALCTLRTHNSLENERIWFGLRACEALPAGWPILFYWAVCEPALGVARHASVSTDCRFMNKVDARASVWAVCGFTISRSRSYSCELADNRRDQRAEKRSDLREPVQARLNSGKEQWQSVKHTNFR
ncbi:hypothetical protein EAG_03577 [Camponotus floridanus]|uniref:Uncharacterized protein n=1 Tax=Camponotus floridanus TaxID=104421 RepID=E2ANX5_CAMFO|nr:hypothetical protein EAG_03577 [Camponotus floridanus]